MSRDTKYLLLVIQSNSCIIAHNNERIVLPNLQPRLEQRAIFASFTQTPIP